VVLVTGGASGIGRELALALAARGADLVLADKDAAGLEQVRERLAAAGRGVRAVVADVCEPAAVAALAERAFQAAGRVDGLVNCAGIYPVTGALEMSVEDWDRVVDTNLRGPFLATQAVARRMIAAGIAGSIVNIGSTASLIARPGIAHYGASKAGLNQLTRILAVELAPHGIRVNAVLPGVIGTAAVHRLAATPEGRRETEAKLQRIPLGRLGTPAEVVALVLFVLSPQASYCTGGLFTVDGGFSLGMPGY
jgi:NAD(P)-dependent dehydrogenase (short-subunit alcohol dehydrogenase family)